MATTTEQGYGHQHQKLRRHWQREVEAGRAECTAKICLVEQDTGTRWIHPADDWHLGHNDQRTDYDGPQHARCNTSDGGRRARRRERAKGPKRWDV